MVNVCESVRIGENCLENGKECNNKERKRVPLLLVGTGTPFTSSNHNARRRHDHSPSQQDRDALLHCRLGFFSQHRIIIVADRVGNHGKGVLGHPRHLGHNPGRLDEPVGDDRRCGNTNLLSRDGIVQTAR